MIPYRQMSLIPAKIIKALLSCVTSTKRTREVEEASCRSSAMASTAAELEYVRTQESSDGPGAEIACPTAAAGGGVGAERTGSNRATNQSRVMAAVVWLPAPRGPEDPRLGPSLRFLSYRYAEVLRLTVTGTFDLLTPLITYGMVEEFSADIMIFFAEGFYGRTAAHSSRGRAWHTLLFPAMTILVACMNWSCSGSEHSHEFLPPSWPFYQWMDTENFQLPDDGPGEAYSNFMVLDQPQPLPNTSYTHYTPQPPYSPDKPHGLLTSVMDILDTIAILRGEMFVFTNPPRTAEVFDLTV
ncbi:matrix metalloproteinase-14b [Lates japonicus]|uniref:Matrix metalloproteinase-14b n=1 Tax=Lates japonicus TaxID=270547 RepID=A0AAD3MDD2_LATJO|nr:matrix metalloproteinase-14b [Lates japonicus]